MLAPFDYTSMLFAVALGYWWFGDLPTAATLIGTPLVIAAGLLIIYRERQLGLARAKARATAVDHK